LVKQLRGDPEWTTMRALENDRKQLYTSAADLAEDIDRHLHDELVTAGRPGALYQLRRAVVLLRKLRSSAPLGLDSREPNHPPAGPSQVR
jgi:hypothetical protein